MKNVVFKKDGYDYEAYIDGVNTGYCITNICGVWVVYKNDYKDQGFDYLTDAKEHVKYLIIKDEQKKEHLHTYILVAFTVENGFARNTKILENDSNKERLEYLLNSARYDDLKNKGYFFKIYQEC